MMCYMFFVFLFLFFFFFNDTATTEIYTLSLHDALPIWRRVRPRPLRGSGCQSRRGRWALSAGTLDSSEGGSAPLPKPPPDAVRAAGRRGAGAPPSEASNLRTAPAKPALEAERSLPRRACNPC